MGCSASKSRPHTFITKNSDHHSFSDSPSSSPFPRTLSLPTTLVHHPPLRKGDTHHLVCLTSTTYGSLLLIDPKDPALTAAHDPSPSPPPPPDPNDSLSPDSVINAWELMDGLDDHDFDFHAPKKPTSLQCLGTDLSPKKQLGAFDSMKSVVGYSPSPPLSKPLWQHLSEEALLANMDPNVAASYSRALSSRQLSYNNQPKTLQKPIPPPPPLLPDPPSSGKPVSSFSLPGTEDRIVLYFTSLRGIRKTYEDCCSVQMIIRSFRVPVDERDISMDSEFKRQLQNVFGGKAMTLPQVFVRGKHIGGADEIKQLNEFGELTKLLEGFPIRDPGFVCESCGDARFVPCPNCNGSRKIFEEEEGQLRRCPDCNENGLIRCPGCCS